MKAERSSLWLSMFANLGVLVGLILLVVEIRHNTAATQAVLHQESISFGRDHIELLVSDQNRELADIIFRGEADLNALSASELRKFTLFTAWRIAPWESLFLHYDEGLVSQRDWKSFDTGYSSLLTSFPGYRRWWDEVGHSYDTGFQDHVNKLFEGLRED